MRHQRPVGPAATVIALVLASALGASPQQPVAQRLAPADAERVFRGVLARYYEALARKDLNGVEALWHPQGPARSFRNLLEVQFERQSVALVGLRFRDVAVDAGGGRARVLVELDVTDVKTKQTRRERRVRDYTFLPHEGDWKIWNEGSDGLGRELASRLLAAPVAERAVMFASDPEIRSDDTLAGLRFAANQLRSRGSLGEVVTALKLRADLARDLGNEPVLAESLLDVGLVYQVQGRQDEAGRAFVEARDLYARVGTRLEVATLDANIGAVDYVRGDYAAAAARYRQALEAFEAEKEEARVATALHSYGNALYMLGEFEQAMDAYRRSLSLHEEESNKYAASSVLQAIALVHRELGSYDAAIESYSRSLSFSRDADDAVGMARAEHGLGEVHRLVGDFPRALLHFTASLGSWEKTPDLPSRAATLCAAGQVYAIQRDFDKAIERYQQALEIDDRAGAQAGAARDLGALGGAHFGQGRLDVALTEYEKSLALREQLKDIPGTMWTLVHIGLLETAQGRHSKALEAYQRALSMAEQAGDSAAVATVLALRSANELQRKDVETAIATAGKAAEIAQRIELLDALAFARLTLGRALVEAGRPDEARGALEGSIAALEGVSPAPAAETFFDDRRGPYLAMIDLLVSQRRGAEAFRWSERARVQSLGRLLGADRSIVVKGLTAAERDEERRLSRDVRTLAVRLRRERGRDRPDESRLARIGADMDRARAARAAASEQLLAAHPGLAALRSQVEPASVETAAAALVPSEALLSFVVTEARTYVFVVVREAGGAVALARLSGVEIKAGELASQVRALSQAIATRDRRARALAESLHALLLTPVRTNLARVRSLVIVPDAFLWGLPFEALCDERGRYLVQDFPVSYAPSLTALAAMTQSRAARTLRRPSLVAAADPAIAPAAADHLALMRRGEALQKPVSTGRTEVRRITAPFAPADCRTFSGGQARAENVLAALAARPEGALHLSVPAVLADPSPLYSLVAMSPGTESGHQGLFDLGDMMGWNVPAAFVMLPRADTEGAATSGEALVAVAWSLFVAGSPATVIARRPAGGQQAASLQAAFYRAWAAAPRGARPSAAEALQRAARALIARPGSAPADWMGLMVIGR